MLSLAPLVFASSLGLFAQGKPTISPEVHPDHTVTFRIKAPNAKKVSVNIEGKGDVDLAIRDDGVWEGTSNALPPDIYGYTINVDGTAMFDPMNPEIKVNLIYVSNMVTVPGDPPEPWEIQDVPHGEVHHHFYKSGIIGDQRDFLVYTPPGYAGSRAKLPVLYLLHGFSDNAEGWTVVGKANFILDNLIAEKKVKPMIVVMPLGYGVPGFASHSGRNFGDRSLTTRNFTNFRSALLTEVLPMVEKQYRVSARREDRAIAGLSMGGAETLFTGLENVDKFAYIGAFSSGGLPANKPDDVFGDVTAESTKKLKVFWMSCGTADGLIGFQRGFADWCTQRGIKVTTNESGGGHEWPNWRRYLVQFTQMIFK